MVRRGGISAEGVQAAHLPIAAAAKGVGKMAVVAIMASQMMPQSPQPIHLRLRES